MRILTKKGHKCFEVGPLGEGCADGEEGLIYSLVIAMRTEPLTEPEVVSFSQPWS